MAFTLVQSQEPTLKTCALPEPVKVPYQGFFAKKRWKKRLDKLFRIRGADHVNNIRDHAGGIAQQLDMQKEYDKLDDLIGSMQGTRDTNIKSDEGKARKSQNPYDPDHVDLFLKFLEICRILLHKLVQKSIFRRMKE